MNKNIWKKSLLVLILFVVCGITPGLAQETTPETPLEFLRTQNVLKPDEENIPAERLLKREEWVRWVLRANDFNGDTIVKEPFQDVENNSYISKAWRIEAVKTAPNFFPNRPITGAEALKILLKVQEISTENVSEKDSSKWGDLPEEMTLRAAVLRAVEREIWKPESATKLGVGKRLTREQGADLLFRLLTAPKTGTKGIITIKNSDKGEVLREQKFDFIWKALQNQFLYEDRLDEEKLIDESLAGLLSSLHDKYTEYLPKPKARQFEESITGELEGIGAQLGLNSENAVLITKIFTGTPADRSDLRVGDIIRKVDGQDMTGKTTAEVASFIKGPKGTSVMLMVLRGSNEVEITLPREKIKIEYVEALLDGNILSISILTFGDRTAQTLRDLLEQYLENEGVIGGIIDLRGNPGGGLNEVLKMLGNFLPPESIGIWEEARDGTFKKEVIFAGDPFLDIPLVVLIDENSASASEIFAGAIQDYKRGMVVGTKSFGKGTVQNLVNFADGSSFKFTIARWLTPNKRSIDGIGVIPDVVVTAVEGKDQDYEVAKNLIKRGQANSRIGQ